MTGIFFNGRRRVTPAAMSVVDDSAMYSKALTVGNVLAVIGTSEGGAPFSELRFGSAKEARAVLRSGTLLTAIEGAFDPSNETSAPSLVIGIRVNPALPSALLLVDSVSAAPSIQLNSTDYGAYTVNTKVKVEDGTLVGKKVSTQLGATYYSQDNVYREAFSVQYTGAQATCTMDITATQVIFKTGVPVLATLDLSRYSTAQSLVDGINTVAGLSAKLLDSSPDRATQNGGLDIVSALDVKTAIKTATSTLGAIIDWINSSSEGFVTASLPVGYSGKLPANINWTYLTGGTDGSTTAAEWQKAYDVLQAADVQWVVPATSAAAIHAMNDAHLSYMSMVAGMERRSICGSALATTDDAALALAKALNSDRTSLVHLGIWRYDATGTLQLYPPYILAAQLAGMFSGVNPGTALTNKTFKCQGLERKLRNPTDTDRLIEGGVLCVEERKKGFVVTKSISTWLANSNYNRVEQSTGVACDYTSRNVREAVDGMIGAKGNPQAATLILERVKSTLTELARPEPMGPGVLAGDEKNPPFKNITVTIDGDAARIEFQASPVIPINYEPIVVHAVPWSGSASA